MNGKILVFKEVPTNERVFDLGPLWLLDVDYIEVFKKCGIKIVFYSSDNKAEMGDECHFIIFEKTD